MWSVEGSEIVSLTPLHSGPEQDKKGPKFIDPWKGSRINTTSYSRNFEILIIILGNLPRTTC